MQVNIKTPSSADTYNLAKKLNDAKNGYEVVTAADNMVKIVIFEDRDAAFKVLALLVTAQPWYFGMESVLRDALISAANLLANRGNQIDAADGSTGTLGDLNPCEDGNNKINGLLKARQPH